MLKESPAATAFSPIVDKTFDQKAYKKYLGEDNVSTFSNADRFQSRPKVLADIIAKMPLQHGSNDSEIGAGVTQAKQ